MLGVGKGMESEFKADKSFLLGRWNILEVDNGDSCTPVNAHLMAQNYALLSVHGCESFSCQPHLGRVSVRKCLHWFGL